MATPYSNSVRIAVVGDVHDFWDPVKDRKALAFLQPDLVLLTGDFGNENVELINDVSRLAMPKAIILGNHDCWWSTRRFVFEDTMATINPITGSAYVPYLFFFDRKYFPTLPTITNAVDIQLNMLGSSHVGFNRQDFSNLNLSVVGGRPFSSGGQEIFGKEHCVSRYGINNLKQSSDKMIEMASGAPPNYTLIFLAHNGPSGLGSNANDICGRDWTPTAGDHGDSDLEEALSFLKENRQLKVPLVVFGHMHKKLQNQPGHRRMVMVENDTVYVNGAIVPRIRKHKVDDSGVMDTGRGQVHAFTIVEMVHGNVSLVMECWVLVGDEVSLYKKTVLFTREVGLPV